MLEEKKVSIIIPAYNVEDYITDTLNSVINQTYQNWEALVVDDCSCDQTANIIKEFCSQDNRFKYLALTQNSGAAIARNKAIECAVGKYLAFIDSDDIWKPEKLEKQIQFMEQNGYYFTCTDYGKIDAAGNIKNRVIKAKKKYDYNEILKNCPGNSTIVYDCEKIGKVYAEDIKRRNDFVMWLKTIKIAKEAYGLNEILTYHRERNDSISYKKTTLLKYQWKVYRDIEKLAYFKSVYLMIHKVGQGLLIKFTQ